MLEEHWVCKLLCSHIQEQLAFEGAAGLLQGGSLCLRSALEVFVNI